MPESEETKAAKKATEKATKEAKAKKEATEKAAAKKSAESPTKKERPSPRYPDDPFIVRNKRGKLIKVYPSDLDNPNKTKLIGDKQLEILQTGVAVSEMRK